jgi:hypothetical protein
MVLIAPVDITILDVHARKTPGDGVSQALAILCVENIPRCVLKGITSADSYNYHLININRTIMV